MPGPSISRLVGPEVAPICAPDASPKCLHRNWVITHPGIIRNPGVTGLPMLPIQSQDLVEILATFTIGNTSWCSRRCSQADGVIAGIHLSLCSIRGDANREPGVLQVNGDPLSGYALVVWMVCWGCFVSRKWWSKMLETHSKMLETHTIYADL